MINNFYRIIFSRATIFRSSFLFYVLLAVFSFSFHLVFLTDPAYCAQESSSGRLTGIGSGFVNFSYDDVDVRAFVKSVRDMTGKMFIVDEKVDGKITVVAPRVERDQVYPLFVTILESAGCTVVKDNETGIYRIVPLDGRDVPVAPVVGDQESLPLTGMVTKVFKINHVTVGQLHNVLISKVGGGKKGAIAVVEETNHIVVTDTASSVRTIARIIEEIDRPGHERTTEVIALKHAEAEEMASQLSAALMERANRGQRLKNRLPAIGQDKPWDASASIVASPRSNNLILTGTQSQIDHLKRVVEKMDVETSARGGRLNAIFLKYISAEEAAKSISGLLEKATGKNKSDNRISIEASVANNALLVDASPNEFNAVEGLINQLDRLPEQVHIEVMILEVTQTDDFTLGVEMAAMDQPGGIDDSVVVGSSITRESAQTLLQAVQDGIFPRGINVAIASGRSVDDEGNLSIGYPGLINIEAMKEDGRIEIKSRPSLQVENNKEASVSIVNDIPILRSTIEGGSGTARDVIQNIERMEVGIQLKLTPHVIDNEEIRIVLNPSIETVVDQGSADTQFTPTIARREVSTTVTVKDGNTIVIAGLTREDKNERIRKVPVLGSIPLLGILFRRHEDVAEKTDILILVTPRIVSSAASAGDMMRDWENRTGASIEDMD